MEQVLFIVVIKDKKTGEIVDTIGAEGMNSSTSLRVLAGVRINLDHRRYTATTELLKVK